MKIVFRTVLFHILCIFIFALFYFYFQDQFEHQFKDKFDFLDYLLLSTTIQAGVGISDTYPISSYAKMIMIMQQITLIMTHVFTIYIFTV